jgi:hypothetical protein
LSSENVGEILARFNTEEQVRAAFPDYPGMRMQKITLHTEKIFTKTSKHENIHVYRLPNRAGCFFNNELRLEHNTVERKTNQNIYITSDEKKKRDCFIENGKYIFNGSSSPVSDFYTKKESKNHLTTDQNLIKERASQ